MKILVSWDDPSELELIQLYLSLGGENDVEVQDLRALAGPVRNGWDVALLSQTLPTADEGFAAFLALRSKCPDLPIVIMTGYSEVGAIDPKVPDAVLLKKPYRLEELTIAVDRALSRGERDRPPRPGNVVALHRG